MLLIGALSILKLMKAVIESFVCQKSLVAAGFNDSAVVDNDDPVGLAYR